jgi:hypothetical protein
VRRTSTAWTLGLLGLLACALAPSALTACAQAQTPSNVGGDGIDRGAAAASLGSIEATACSEAGGPRGKVHFYVVFAPDGTVTEAAFDKARGDAPTAIAGTARGDCLLARLRDLHVPAFRGAPTKVGRLVTLD